MKLSESNLPRSSLAALTEASAAINSSLEPSVVLAAIARSAAEVMQAEASSVLLLDRRRKKLVFAAAVGDRGDALVGEEFDATLGIAGHVIATRKPQSVGDVHDDNHFYSGIDDMSAFHTRGLIAAPLIHKSEVIGVVEVLNRKEGGSFGGIDLELLAVFANLAAIGAANAQTHATLQRDNKGLRESVLGLDRVIGQSGAFKQVLKLCDRVAGSNASVLLLGETGTGKEVAARYIYQQSRRHDRPFIGLNCAALTETLLESELFGHEKGAFTGATVQKVGRFELADGGTLFLDEIGDISPSTQVKLLRVLEERELVRVGGTKTVACDARIIAATNRNLKAAVADGTFREDLYYRLNVFPVEMPPLRERREDIAVLIEYFVKQAGFDLGVAAPAIAPETVAIMTSHSWPGNIRELKNVVERAVLMCDGDTLLPAHLPREIAGAAAESLETQGDASLWGYERAMIIKALTDADWNQSAAARALGISRDNLRYRIKKYNIEKPE
ncbi:MAG TPA: sigma 54-interacting transcriptional regulator [Phycisphaerae bacterium]|nr:sigma 54-interacting transcriptional regulator [Phycisphaerae bacterium]